MPDQCKNQECQEALELKAQLLEDLEKAGWPCQLRDIVKEYVAVCREFQEWKDTFDKKKV